MSESVRLPAEQVTAGLTTRQIGSGRSPIPAKDVARSSSSAASSISSSVGSKMRTRTSSSSNAASAPSLFAR